jgi:hypothetical protein
MVAGKGEAVGRHPVVGEGERGGDIGGARARRAVETGLEGIALSAAYPLRQRPVGAATGERGELDARRQAARYRQEGGPTDIDPIILGLLKRLPTSGNVWPEAERKLWLQLLEGSFKLIYKDAESPKSPKRSQAEIEAELSRTHERI